MITFTVYSLETINVRDSVDVGQKAEQVKVCFTTLQSVVDLVSFLLR